MIPSMLHVLFALDVFWFLTSIVLIDYVLILRRRIDILENNNDWA